MPLKLNVGVSRKVGLPDYGSVGASCNLELELDSGLLERDLDGFQARVRDAYVAAHQAVHDELARLQVPVPSGPDTAPTEETPRRNRRADHNGTLTEVPDGRTRGGKPATSSQLKAIAAIARRQEADLAGLLRREFGVQRAEHLSLRQASELIDLLKSTAGA